MMEEELYAAMIDLKVSIDRQNELQETATNVMRALIDALQGNATAIDECRATLMDVSVKHGG